MEDKAWEGGSSQVSVFLARAGGQGASVHHGRTRWECARTWASPWATVKPVSVGLQRALLAGGLSGQISPQGAEGLFSWQTLGSRVQAPSARQPPGLFLGAPGAPGGPRWAPSPLGEGGGWARTGPASLLCRGWTEGLCVRCFCLLSRTSRPSRGSPHTATACCLQAGFAFVSVLGSIWNEPRATGMAEAGGLGSPPKGGSKGGGRTCWPRTELLASRDSAQERRQRRLGDTKVRGCPWGLDTPARSPGLGLGCWARSPPGGTVGGTATHCLAVPEARRGAGTSLRTAPAWGTGSAELTRGLCGGQFLSAPRLSQHPLHSYLRLPLLLAAGGLPGLAMCPS